MEMMSEQEEMDRMYSEGKTPSKESDPASVDEEAAKAPTALLPKSVFGGGEVKEGETITVKVVSVHDDEVEVAKVSSAKPGMSADDELESMNEEKGY